MDVLRRSFSLEIGVAGSPYIAFDYFPADFGDHHAGVQHTSAARQYG